MNKTRKKDNQKTFLVKKTAEIHRVSTSLVYKVLLGDRNNDEVLFTYMDLEKGVKGVVEENTLLEEVRKLLTDKK